MISPFDSFVVRTTCKLMVPFLQVFGLYVVIHGHESPGGGFQGGAIIAASIILTRITQARQSSQSFLPGRRAVQLGAIGVLIYFGVGIAPMLWGGSFLDYGKLPLFGLPTAKVRSLGIFAVEIGVAAAVAGVMVSIFDDLAPPADEES